jgi:hypothetical protein
MALSAPVAGTPAPECVVVAAALALELPVLPLEEVGVAVPLSVTRELIPDGSGRPSCSHKYEISNPLIYGLTLAASFEGFDVLVHERLFNPTSPSLQQKYPLPNAVVVEFQRTHL